MHAFLTHSAAHGVFVSEPTCVCLQLQSHFLMASIPESDLKRVVAVMKQVSFPAGAAVIRQVHCWTWCLQHARWGGCGCLFRFSTFAVLAPYYYSQGDVGDNFYVVGEGSLTVTVHGKRVAELESGSNFGDLALMYNCPRYVEPTTRTHRTRPALAVADVHTPVCHRQCRHCHRIHKRQVVEPCTPCLPRHCAARDQPGSQGHATLAAPVRFFLG